MTIGKEHQSAYPDYDSTTVYQARETFLQFMPVAYTAVLKIRSFKGREGRMKSASPPLNNFVGIQRFLYDKGSDNKKVLEEFPTILSTNVENVMDNFDNFIRQGIDPQKIIRPLTQTAKHISTKLHATYAIARAWGWDNYKKKANHMLEEEPSILTRDVGKIRTLGRISVELFDRHAHEDTSVKMIRRHFIQSLETQVAAYLKNGKKISTPEGLSHQARWLEGYTTDELRGFIYHHAQNNTDDKGRPADPVIRTYLRNFPISDEEAELLPYITELSPRRKADLIPQIDDSPEAYRTNVHAPTHPDYIRRLRAFPPASSEQHHEWLDAVAAGLNVEAEQATVDENLKARKQLHASLASKVLDMTYPNSSRHIFDGEDAEQDGMLKLMKAILTLAERRRDKRPENIWPYLEEKIRTTKLTLAEDDSDETPYTTESPEL